MSVSSGLTFEKIIQPTIANSIAYERLLLQDAIAAGSKDPRDIGDPDNQTKVDTRQRILRDEPQKYCGYTLHGDLVGIMKQNYWKPADEQNFAEGIHAKLLLVRRLIGKRISQLTNEKINPNNWTLRWGVHGLVASDSLSEEDRHYVLKALLWRSTLDRWSVDIVMDDNDPLLDIALQMGFKRLGKPGEPASQPGTPTIGLIQKRYRYTHSH